MAQSEMWKMEASQVARAVKAKELSPVEVLEAFIGRVEQVDLELNAFCTRSFDYARTRAKEIEKAVMRGEPTGPLAGVPVAVKDLICTKGIRTVSGSVAYKEFVPEEDDVVVERLKDADSLIMGKTNVPEFGYSGVGHNPVFPTTRNPWNLEMTPGGSSAGSGAAVASGMCPIALGSDGGGSVRIPAAHCGLFGLKASMGRVPLYPGTKDERYPGVSSWESLEHIGPLSRTVEDGALVMSVMAGPDPRDRLSIPDLSEGWLSGLSKDIKGKKIAYSSDLGYAPVDPRVRDVVGKAVKVFERELGCHVEEASPQWPDPYEAFWGLVAGESDLRGLRAMVDKYANRMTPHLVEFIRRDWKAEDLTDAVMMRKAVNNRMWRFMADYDLLVTPTLAVPPFAVNTQGPEKIDGKIVPPFYWLAFTFPFNMTGQPAASVPAGWTEDGLPVGLQIIGRHLDDRSVLQASAAFEKAAPWKEKWPRI